MMTVVSLCTIIINIKHWYERTKKYKLHFKLHTQFHSIPLFKIFNTFSSPLFSDEDM